LRLRFRGRRVLLRITRDRLDVGGDIGMVVDVGGHTVKVGRDGVSFAFRRSSWEVLS
jgi:hypothetical protein